MTPSHQPSLLGVQGLSCTFDGTVVLPEQTLEFSTGVTMLTGPNGSGKTTLLKLLAGELNLQTGTVLYNRCRLSRKERIRGSAYLRQEPTLPLNLTAENFLRYAGWLHGLTASQAHSRARDVLQSVQLDMHAQLKLKDLSSGMRRRAALAAQLIKPDFSILLLDEPTASLDYDSKRVLHRMIKELARTLVVVVSTHDPEDVALLGGTVYILECGKPLVITSVDNYLAERRAPHGD